MWLSRCAGASLAADKGEGNVLVVWDFDWSLVNENSDTFVLRELAPALRRRAPREGLRWDLVLLVAGSGAAAAPEAAARPRRALHMASGMVCLPTVHRTILLLSAAHRSDLPPMVCCPTVAALLPLTCAGCCR